MEHRETWYGFKRNVSGQWSWLNVKYTEDPHAGYRLNTDSVDIIRGVGTLLRRSYR